MPKAIEIDSSKMRSLMRLKPTLADTAAFFECTERTIERYIHKEFHLTFVEFREQNMVHTRLSIIRKAIEKAEKGDNIMLIFCLKNLCGWKDREDSVKFYIDGKEYSPEQIIKELASKIPQLTVVNGK